MIPRYCLLALCVAASQAAVGGDAPVDIAHSRSRGRILKIASPEYPAQAASHGLSGVVRVDAVVRPDGYAEGYTYTPDKPESSVFVDSLKRVTREWKFAPLLGGDCYPVPTQVTAEVSFELDKETPRIFVTPIGKPQPHEAALPHHIPVNQEKPYYPWDRQGIGIAAVTFVKFTVDRAGNVTSAKARSFTPQKAPAETSPVSRELARRLADMQPFDQATELAVMSWKFPPVPSGQPAPWSGCWEARFPERY